jgi:hypothetical protein
MKSLLVTVMAAVSAVAFVNSAVADDDRRSKDRWSLAGAAEAINNPVELASVCTADPPFSSVDYRVRRSMTFADISELSTLYNVTDDDCFGGSPRFQIRLDLNGNGVNDPNPTDGNIFVYIGPQPNFSQCAQSWQGTGNLIGIPDTDKRYDLTQVGGTFYDTYANALAIHGGTRVLGISLVVDSCWGFADQEQTVLVANTSVNGNKLNA